MAGAQVTSLVEELMVQPIFHCKHAFANFVMQHILEYGPGEHKKRLIGAITTDIHRLSKHRVANHVVRCAFTHGDESDHERLVEALRADAKALTELRQNHYGSFIVREFRRYSDC